jgi:formate dehydrogenase subunit gamma
MASSVSSWQRMHFRLGSLLLLLPLLAPAAVPNQSAVPAYAEEQTILQLEKDTPEPGLGSSASGRQHFDRHFIVPLGNQSEQDVILQRGGNTWRTLRNGPIATVSGIVLLVVPLLLFGVYLLVAPARLERPESGRQVTRFSLWQRTIHWATAISFLLMAASGLLILFGKKILLPLIGYTAFSWLAVIAKYLHNFVGPLFIVCTLLLFATFVHRNFFRRYDWTWFKKGGGLLTHEHVPAGYFNAGEKLWFWGGVTLLGLLMSVSGLLLDFVNFGQTRYILQWANYLHVGGATLFTAAAMGHIYMGIWGTPGAYSGMRHGTVDEEWARTHHEYWYSEMVSNSRTPSGPASSTPQMEPRH